MSEALIAPTYAEAAQMHRHFRLLFGHAAALEYLLDSTPAPTGAQLQDWLATPANRAAFEQLASSPAGAAALCANSAICTAMAGSATAMQCLFASEPAVHAMLVSRTAMAAIAANTATMQKLVNNTYMQGALAMNRAALSVVAEVPAAVSVLAEHATTMGKIAADFDGIRTLAASATAMAVIAASNTAMPILLANANARTALYDGTTAWDALAAAPVARAAMDAVAQEHSTTSITHVYPTGVAAGVKVAFLRQKASSVSYQSAAGTSADTYTTTSTAYIDRYVRVIGLTHRVANSQGNSMVRYLIVQ